MIVRPSALWSLGLAAFALATAGCGDAGPSSGGEPSLEPTSKTTQAVDTLSAVTGFGSNPGSLLMYTYAPSGAPSNAPLVLALHGCGEAATDYEAAGWNALADKYGFYVVYPQQQSANDIEDCFNWYGNTSGSLADITRGQGEAESIAQMVAAMQAAYSIDPKRIYATGFSGGAAYAVALLALYPDVFAAGASFSGIPFGCANSLSNAYTCMDSATSKTPDQWGTLAKAGFPGYSGPYPRLSVWQGSADTTVNTANFSQLVAQWTNLTGASATATSQDTVGGFPHASYADGSGTVQVESYSITGMSHAVAIDTSNGCGTASTYFVDEKVCAVTYAAQFFGIVPKGGGGSSSSSGGSGSGGSGSSGGGSGGGSGSGTSPAGSSSGSVTSSGSGGAGDAPDAGAAAATATMPGCAVAWGDSGASGVPFALAVVGLGALVRRRRGKNAVRAVLAAGLRLGAPPRCAPPRAPPTT